MGAYRYDYPDRKVPRFSSLTSCPPCGSRGLSRMEFRRTIGRLEVDETKPMRNIDVLWQKCFKSNFRPGREGDQSQFAGVDVFRCPGPLSRDSLGPRHVLPPLTPLRKRGSASFTHPAQNASSSRNSSSIFA